MEDIVSGGENREAVRSELLECLKRFEEEGWEIFGWHHMHLEKIKWLPKVQKLKTCPYYKVIKGWLRKDGGIPVVAKDHDPKGLVQYKGENADFAAKSIFFSLWLLKGGLVCCLSYGEHSFKQETLEKVLGRANYSIAFKNWKEIIPGLLSKNSN